MGRILEVNNQKIDISYYKENAHAWVCWRQTIFSTLDVLQMPDMDSFWRSPVCGETEPKFLNDTWRNKTCTNVQYSTWLVYQCPQWKYPYLAYNSLQRWHLRELCRALKSWDTTMQFLLANTLRVLSLEGYLLGWKMRPVPANIAKLGIDLAVPHVNVWHTAAAAEWLTAKSSWRFFRKVHEI